MKRPIRVPVRIGEVKVGRSGEVLCALGLGSCVAITLWDPEARVGGMAHAMLPDPADGRRPTPLGRFAATAVQVLIDQMRMAGAAPVRLRARLVGGASMFESVAEEHRRNLGQRNVAAATRALDAVRIPLVGKDVGGGHGRSVFLHTTDGRLLVSSMRAPDVEL
jgi:chemotaxis protein CheD